MALPRHPTQTSRLLAWFLLAATSGCAAPEPDLSGFVVRDSAGIEIIESLTPLWAPEEVWLISAQPIVEIHAYQGGAETHPLDPISIDVDSNGRILVADAFAPSSTRFSRNSWQLAANNS